MFVPVCIALSLVMGDAPSVVVGSSATANGPVEPAVTGARDPAATAAYEEAQRLAGRHAYQDAVAKLDYASELEPTWSEPVALRAEIFAKLAEQHRPSQTFTAARAAELQRLLELEPGVDAEQRRHEIAALQVQSREAERIERRNRRLTVPAGLLLTSSIALLAAGAMLYAMKPREALLPSSYLSHRRDKAGIALMAMGGILAPPAIALTVLAVRQAKRDRATRDFELETDRPRPQVAVAPTMVRAGGGLGLAMRF